jgi:hypothetical protein
MALGIELVCTVGLIVSSALHWQPVLTVVAADGAFPDSCPGLLS